MKTLNSNSASDVELSSNGAGSTVAGKSKDAATAGAAPPQEASVAKIQERTKTNNSDSASDVEPSSTGEGSTAAGKSKEAADTNAASPQETSVAYGQDCNAKNDGGGDNGWTLDEETALVKHMQKIFEPNFDASVIFSLLPEKSEEDIKKKWRMLSSSLLSDLSKRKHEDRDELADPTNNDKLISPRQKKKHKTDSTENWTEADLERLMETMEEYNSTTPKWDDIAPKFPGKTPVDCLTQWQSMSIPHQVKGKGSWTPGEDAILRAKYRMFGNKWSKIAEFLPGRSGKQCRERFVNHLDPNLKKCEWSDDEEAILIGMHKHHGNKWTLISKNLPGRSDNDVKNHWYSTITRKFQIHGKDKLTVAAIQQVFMLVTAGIVSRDLIRDWPGAPSAQVPPPHAYQSYWYGHSIPPNGYHSHHPLPPSMPMPYTQPTSDANAAHHSQLSYARESRNDVADNLPSSEIKEQQE